MLNYCQKFLGNADQRIKEDYLRILRYFRFFGRLAESDDAHEKKTLEVIRNNVQGIAKISGERIWSEWKKILQGPMGGRLTLRMIDVGLAQYIGLPENPNCTQLEKILKTGQTLHPATLVTQLLDDLDQATKLNLKVSHIIRLDFFKRSKITSSTHYATRTFDNLFAKLSFSLDK